MFTKETKTVVVPESTYEDTVLRCSKCEYTTDTEDFMELHFAREHAVAEEKTLHVDFKEYKLYKFLDLESYKVYHENIDDFSYSASSFTGPGWYIAQHEYGSCRCGGGCGQYYWMMSLSKYIADIRKDAEDSLIHAANLEKENV